MLPSITVWRSDWPGWTCGCVMNPLGRPITSNSMYSPPVSAAVVRNSIDTPRLGASITSPDFAIVLSSFVAGSRWRLQEDYGASALLPDHSGLAVTLGRLLPL